MADTVTTPEPVFFNPLQEGYTEDPWSHYAELREQEPVHFSLINQWFLFNYDDVSALLRDPSLSVDDENLEEFDAERMAAFDEAFDGERSTSMLGRDAPDHTRLRRLVSKAFTPSTIADLRPMVEQLVDDALDIMEERGTAEIVSELAFPLPFDVISKMLGMPDADRDQIAEWSSALVKTLDPINSDEEITAAAHGEM
jgi:cytochrome P450